MTTEAKPTEPTEPSEPSEPEVALDQPPPIEGDGIGGHVTDFDGVPLVGVRVEVASASAGALGRLPVMTDGEGRFLLEGLEDGRYDLAFRLGTVRGRALGVPAGKLDLAVRLARPQGILVVVKTETGSDAPAIVHVVLEREAEGGRKREYVGRHLEARLLLWSLRPGTWRVTVWGGPYLPVTATGIRVYDGRPAPEVELLLGARGGAVHGRVVDATGASVPAAWVAWRRRDGDDPWPRHLANAQVDDEGRFLAQGLPAGAWRFLAGTPAGPLGETLAEVPEGETVEVEVRLPA